MFGIDKGVALKQPRNRANFDHQADVFNNTGHKLGDCYMESALVSLYSGSQRGDNTEKYRLEKKNSQKVGSSISSVPSQTLPTSAADY